MSVGEALITIRRGHQCRPVYGAVLNLTALLAAEGLPQGAGRLRGRRRRGRRYYDDARLTGAHQAQLAAGHPLDVLVRLEVFAEDCELVVPLLKAHHLLTEARFVLADLDGLKGVVGGGKDEVDDRDGGGQDDPPSG